MNPPPVAAAPSATLVLLRDAPKGVEVLLVRRNRRLDFHGGAWVFPGGRIDDADRASGVGELDAARRAAVRELQEEAGLTVDPEPLLHVSTWTTPEIAPKRFRTLFFVARGDGAVQVDGGEIHDHRWIAPRVALEQQIAGELELPPPQHVTLLMIEPFASVDDVLDSVRASEPIDFTPRFVRSAGDPVCLYEGDAGYETGVLDAPGARHRLWLSAPQWRYERS
ncbi:MAG: NUDIX hydrolase [Actinobacteria bacterium]|nr:NUDIX hydrolase [Actinomycetota bacterium]